jgi:hypothetical protein
MASFTINAAPWPAGTAVPVYPARAWVDTGRAPFGPTVTSGTVSAIGTVNFDGLEDQARYVAYTLSQGVRFGTSPVGLQQAVAIPDRERIKALEDNVGTGSGSGGGGTSGGVGGDTVDTFEHYRIIMLADGTVRAIPFDTPVPAMPTGVTATARLSSVRVAWTPAPTGAVYIVTRGGVEVTRTDNSSYRDLAITPGSTYTYQVQTIDAYGQRSPITSPVTAFIDPALNVAPTVTVRAWPASFPTNGRTVLRVNAGDVNAQALALALNIDAGTLTATGDPSVWIYGP